MSTSGTKSEVVLALADQFLEQSMPNQIVTDRVVRRETRRHTISVAATCCTAMAGSRSSLMMSIRLFTNGRGIGGEVADAAKRRQKAICCLPIVQLSGPTRRSEKREALHRHASWQRLRVG
jgi:hypothetical protein